ncbi:type II toxin-antitoxin system RelE/ParE family toxin [Nostoc sp.]|uniref:type II toxin-antitoxin system RelE/ParE family toxin n=1 Tax=Nostoc sp. TaxID=1180 RepID=UPI002FF96304
MRRLITRLHNKLYRVPEFDDLNIRQIILKPHRVVYRVEEEKKRISLARFWHSAQENLEL